MPSIPQIFRRFRIDYRRTQKITHKERPNGACCESFPSGHTSTAFMGMAFIHERYAWKYAVHAYISTAYVGHTRVHA